VGYVSVRWETPRFVEYANAQEYLQEMTPQALDWADQLVIPTLKGASGSTWNKAEAWQQLRAHQEAFRGLLDKLIAGGPTQEQMRVLTEHLSHVQPTRRWVDRPTGTGSRQPRDIVILNHGKIYAKR